MRIINGLYKGGEVRRFLTFAEGDDGEGGGGKVEEKPKDTFVSFAQFEDFSNKIAGTLGEMTQAMQAIQANVVAGRQPAPKDAPLITIDDFKKAVVEGDADTIVKYNEQQMALFARDNVNPLRAIGLDAIAGIAKQTAKASLPYYKKYEGEIEALLQTLPLEARVRADAYQVAHDTIVGRHLPEILQSEKEALLRQQADPANAGKPGGRKDDKGEKIPGVAELLGNDAVVALASKGISEDDFARSMGYKGGWPEYAKMYQEQMAEEGA